MVIKSRLKEYKVNIKNDLMFLRDLQDIGNAEYVIDKNVFELYEVYFREIPRDKLIIIEAVEENKIIDTALAVCEKITGLSAKRNATLVSIGGGIIQDITGFAANIVYRGIRWIFVPTTLLAACDSCIGGKTSLNYKKYKNLLGTFYPPDSIYICSEFFGTLTERDFKSGLGEVVKFNIMEGESGLINIENRIQKLMERDKDTANYFVGKSLNFKKRFIESDEFDRGERVKLNFAHTFGHAVEVVSAYAIPHGTAVAIGMVMADSISFDRGYVSRDMKDRSEKQLLSIIDIDISLLDVPLDEYMNAIRKDKKQVDDGLTAVLITNYGEKGELEVIHDLTADEICRAIDYFKELYGALKC